MGKKRKLAHARRPNPPGRRHGNQTNPARAKGGLPLPPPPPKSNNPKSKPPPEKPTIPFSADDAILLVGEGDLSFAASLVDHHGCHRLTATVLEDSADALAAKYPQAAAANAERVTAGDGRVLYGVDARTMGPWLRKVGDNDDDDDTQKQDKNRHRRKVGAMDRILFNFPHVGGKSTDVNRQVRHNQELLVAFFRSALRSLAPGGAIVVTLFEGEPYTLWNVRDLGRHAGLQVERSFRFQFAAYPGYHHARTLGVVRRGKGPPAAHKGGEDEDNGDDHGDDRGDDRGGSDGHEIGADDDFQEAVGAWRGEDRAARSYVFVRKGEVPEPVPKKRKRGGHDSDDDDDDDD